jgi:hypothetical protein
MTISAVTSVLPRIDFSEKKLINARNLAVVGVALVALSNPMVEAVSDEGTGVMSGFMQCFSVCVDMARPVVCRDLCQVLMGNFIPRELCLLYEQSR